MATAMDFTAHRYNEILKLVQGGLDPSIAVAAVEAHGGWPTDSHRRMIAALAGLLKQPEMEVKASTLVTKQVLLHPRNPETNARVRCSAGPVRLLGPNDPSRSHRLQRGDAREM